MKKIKSIAICLSLFCLAMVMATPTTWAAEEYKITLKQLDDAKHLYDDPRPYMNEVGPEKLLPPQVYSKICFDVGAMKKAWAETIGFAAPDVVGKIAPEIKPGKYSYKDKEKYPGLKALMIPNHYERFNPGEPPFAGNFPEIEVVPTRQYYQTLPLAEATRKYAGTAKQDDQGYIIEDSYVTGFPFPKPSGPHKAMQIMYNWDRRYLGGENYWMIGQSGGFGKNLNQDYDFKGFQWKLKLNGRVTIPPFGWYDERAKARGEKLAMVFLQQSPRDNYGNVMGYTMFLGPNDFDQFLLYIAMLRRVRKLSGTDTQDIAGGIDVIYEDNEGFNQKLTPYRFPYKYEVIDEREYLVPACSDDGSEYLTKIGKEFHGLKFERRPIYVIKMTQLDKNYIYGQRILYFDAETLLWHLIENYDQKGRLYRVTEDFYTFYPKLGNFSPVWYNNWDHIDIHSSLGNTFLIPAPWVTRDHTSMMAVVKKGK
jgi:hypothetical protein